MQLQYLMTCKKSTSQLKVFSGKINKVDTSGIPQGVGDRVGWQAPGRNVKSLITYQPTMRHSSPTLDKVACLSAVVLPVQLLSVTLSPADRWPRHPYHFHSSECHPMFADVNVTLYFHCFTKRTLIDLQTDSSPSRTTGRGADGIWSVL